MCLIRTWRLGSDTLDESGGGTDTLDFSASSGQAINIDLGRATSQVVDANLTLTLSSAATFENVIGGSLGDTITGNALANVLIGGAGNDTLLGNDGRDLLVGGTGADRIYGGLGEDILVAGALSDFTETSGSLNANATSAIMAEWTRTDLAGSDPTAYALRIDHLNRGGGLNGSFRLNTSTVLQDSATVDEVLGEGDNDWFLFSLEDLTPDWNVGTEIKTVI